MDIYLNIPVKHYNDIITYLFNSKYKFEETIFLFVSSRIHENSIEFIYTDHYKVRKEDYNFQSNYHIDVKYDLISTVIRKAHLLNASIIEIHSHVDQIQACFSISDILGFLDTVPLLMWRLKNKPYSAIVFGKNSFDALVWLDNPKSPCYLTAIKCGNKLKYPTKRSIKYKNG